MAAEESAWRTACSRGLLHQWAYLRAYRCLHLGARGDKDGSSNQAAPKEDEEGEAEPVGEVIVVDLWNGNKY